MKKQDIYDKVQEAVVKAVENNTEGLKIEGSGYFMTSDEGMISISIQIKIEDFEKLLREDLNPQNGRIYPKPTREQIQKLMEQFKKVEEEKRNRKRIDLFNSLREPNYPNADECFHFLR